MVDVVVSTGPSADSALMFDDEAAHFDPQGHGAGADNTRLAAVWARSDVLSKLLAQRDPPDVDDRFWLRASLIAQLPTLYLYWWMNGFHAALKRGTAPSKAVSLYVLLFPGEARDNTGVKDLNEKVIGQWWNAQYQQRRFDAIRRIFDIDGFYVAAHTYKTAFIITDEKTRTDFVAKLALLDEALRLGLLDVLKQAEIDKSTTEKQKGEIRKLRKVLRKGYRFDIFFGLKVLTPQDSSSLTNVYLLVTEALKGAALARYVAKANTLTTRSARQVAAIPRISPDKLDPRGKEYDWRVYIRASDLGEQIKTMMLKGKIPGATLELNPIYVDTVWTFAFIIYKNLFWGNPDTIRDVRKKRLEPPPKSKGNVTASFLVQKDLLELWLVILNLLDFVKRFKSEEFDNKVKTYHTRALRAFIELGDMKDQDIDWDNLQFVLTHDIRQAEPIAVIDTASEFQFYSTVSNYPQRIFFSMDVRDMGVELMLSLEKSNREVGFQRYSDVDLMQATFRADDPIDTRRRLTYDTVVAVFHKYYNLLAKGPGAALPAAQRAFRGAVDGKLGSFAESVQVMLGGDEVYVAAHPLFAHDVPAILGELEQAPYEKDRTIDLRSSVAFSSADKANAAHQRDATQKSHQEALKLAELAPGTLKSLERSNRRIERLIDMIEANPKKKARAPGYRQELVKLPLTKLFARVKHAWPEQLNREDFAKLYGALLSEDLAAAAAQDDYFELVDFTGKIVDDAQLIKDAAALEAKVRKDVGRDNIRVQAPPIVKIPAWIQAVIDKLLPKNP
jgi:hypothetical protein